MPRSAAGAEGTCPGSASSSLPGDAKGARNWYARTLTQTQAQQYQQCKLQIQAGQVPDEGSAFSWPQQQQQGPPPPQGIAAIRSPPITTSPGNGSSTGTATSPNGSTASAGSSGTTTTATTTSNSDELISRRRGLQSPSLLGQQRVAHGSPTTGPSQTSSQAGLPASVPDLPDSATEETPSPPSSSDGCVPQVAPGVCDPAFNRQRSIQRVVQPAPPAAADLEVPQEPPSPPPVVQAASSLPPPPPQISSHPPEPFLATSSTHPGAPSSSASASRSQSQPGTASSSTSSSLSGLSQMHFPPAGRLSANAAAAAAGAPYVTVIATNTLFASSSGSHGQHAGAGDPSLTSCSAPEEDHSVSVPLLPMWHAASAGGSLNGSFTAAGCGSQSPMLGPAAASASAAAAGCSTVATACALVSRPSAPAAVGPYSSAGREGRAESTAAGAAAGFASVTLGSAGGSGVVTSAGGAAAVAAQREEEGQSGTEVSAAAGSAAAIAAAAAAAAAASTAALPTPFLTYGAAASASGNNNGGAAAQAELATPPTADGTHLRPGVSAATEAVLPPGSPARTTTTTAAAAAVEAFGSPVTAPPLPTGSRVQLSVSLISSTPPPPPSSPSAQPPLSPGAQPPGAATAAAAAVGVPVLLMRPGAAEGVSVPNLMVLGRPAAATTVLPDRAMSAPPGAAAVAGGTADVTAADGVVVLSEAVLDDADVIANITVGPGGVDGGGRVRRRYMVGGSAGGGGGGVETDDGGGGGGEGGGGDAGPCALPAEVRRRLRSHLGRHRTKQIRNWKDLSHCMASPRSAYWLVGTTLLAAVLLGSFLFMAGQYEFVRPIDAAVSDSLSTSLLPDPTSSYTWGPRSLGSWLAFWHSPSSRTFCFDYLRLWGGRYGPDLKGGQWWRWVTSLLLHQNSLHLASNLALLLVLSTYLESIYGFWRVLPVWVVAGVAGNMVSAFFESPCTLVVGSSGAVFGLLGAYVADAGLNFESIPLLWLRMLGMGAVVGLIIALQVTDRGTSGGTSISNASHIGGFLTGLFLTALLLPDFKARRAGKVEQLLGALGLSPHLPPRASPAGQQLYSFWQRHRPLLFAVYAVSGVVLGLVALGLPLYLYLHTFPHMDSC